MRARSGYYWIPDIIDIQVKIKELEAQPERLAKFRTERKTLVEDMNNVSTHSVQLFNPLTYSLSAHETMCRMDSY